MPGGFAISYGQANLNDQGTNAAASVGTTLTASGSINTKGSYTQLVASTPYDAAGFWVMLDKQSSAANLGYLVDIAIGGAGSEQVLIPNIVYCLSNTVAGLLIIWCPVQIPAGSRIAARCQCSTGSATLACSVIISDGSFDEDAALAAPQNYGASTSTSVGTAVDCGGTANTKSAWVQITASTTYDIGALQVIFDKQKAACNGYFLIDIGIGGAGSEKIIIPNLMMQSANPGVGDGPMPLPAPPLIRCQIPAGTRIAIRGQCSVNGSPNRVFGASILGYQQ